MLNIVEALYQINETLKSIDKALRALRKEKAQGQQQ